jgi:cobalt-zinc-cadmium efflux system membrane fusion protein
MQNNGHAEHEGHAEHGKEGVVMLTGQQQEALNLQLGTFQMRNLTTTVKTNGQLEVPPAASAQVTAVIGGNVKEIKVFHGDKVQKGQALAVLEHPEYIELQEHFAETANKLEFLELEYKRQKELFDNNVGAGKDYQQVKSEYNTARSKYEGLKSRLQLLNLSPDNVKNGTISNSITITAPIKGYVNDVNIKVGTYAGAKDELFEITDNSEIHADFMVYEKDVHLVQKGQRVDFTVSNRPDEELTATIFAIGQSFEPNMRAVHIHARLDKTASNLIPGMYVSGHIHTDKNYTLVLPSDAIVTEGTNSYIFIVDNSFETDEHDEHSEVDAHDHNEDMHKQAFRMVEIITGQNDEAYTEVKLLDSIPDDSKIVMNVAYYLLADLKKGEAEHHH